ncbi:DUF4255 domain-containing protein [Xylophilus sp. GOD-11R]|uniref:DUF4255 domain-containing protein n=1 Tax=Xylophilus sp. GOD-11R TaxID=3089814 RepID=UPI00298C2668|nr:DUF4255 domain-containing protein [Xylophilus sp. GOD-11R]WPB55031.1 DUF4255 domain-containing protein [Xylophilus sp. GOD-11R]
MSNALAIAGVTAVLRDLLNDGLINHNISGMLGSSVNVSVLAPDRVVATGGTEASQINLFLYQVTANPGWRNEGLPSRDASGRSRLSNPPLALDLHYLLSVYSGGDLHAEILLGYAMQLLHETPVLTRAAIRTALSPSPDVGTGLPPALRALADSALEDQVELIRLTPHYLNTEEMSKLWTAMQSHFRPTAAYTASVTLIESRLPRRAGLPVLSRGLVDPVTGRDRGVAVGASVVPPLPMLTTVTAPGRQPAVALGDVVTLQGHHLDGNAREVRLINERFEIDLVLAAEALTADDVTGATVLRFALPPELAGTLPVGVYRVGARLTRPGESMARETNQLAMTLAPRITNLPLAVPRDGDGNAAFSIAFLPALRADQTALLVLGQDEHAPLGSGLPTGELGFVVPHAQPGSYLARLRIDGIESAFIDFSREPPLAPVFLNQRVVIT